MDVDENIEFLSDHRCLQWYQLLFTTQPQIPAWVTDYHPQKLPCRIEGPWLHGSYNIGLAIVFSNDDKWFVRFPWHGKTSIQHVDEKVASEVAALEIIRAQTDIPVPEVKAWGLAHENELGLGPFIIEEFIHGQRLNQILSGPNDDKDSVMSDKLDDEKVDIVYRQLARFMLQLFKLDFEQIGSLVGSSRLQPPLTWTANEIIRLSGVNVLGIALPSPLPPPLFASSLLN